MAVRDDFEYGVLGDDWLVINLKTSFGMRAWNKLELPRMDDVLDFVVDATEPLTITIDIPSRRRRSRR